jgi:(p)ppGpp synthase/HD superfamily hydrolase
MITKDLEDLVDRARIYAYKCHRSVNHWYDGHRYEYHLEMTFDWAIKWIYLVPEEARVYVLAAILCHDVYEDCRQSYHDICKNTNEIVADIVYAVSQEKGKNRDEKQNEKYYHGIKSTPFATFVKLCDRGANSEYSSMKNSSMRCKYLKEWDKFKAELYMESYKDMFDDIEAILLGSEVLTQN